MNKKWAIFIDLDGTLISGPGDFDVSTRNINSIRRVQDLGNKVYIVTGRTWPMVKPIYETLGINTPVILNNGATIFDPNNKIPNSDKFIRKDIIHEIVKKFHDRKLFEDFLIVGEKYDYSISIENMYGISYEKLDGSNKKAISSDQIIKIDDRVISLNVKVKNLPEVQRVTIELEDKFRNSIRFVNWGYLDKDKQTTDVEAISVRVNKNEGIKDLLALENISSENIMVFGDGLNDIEMMEADNHSVAMSNAHPNVKMVSTTINKYSNTEDGVGRYLEKFFLCNEDDEVS